MHLRPLSKFEHIINGAARHGFQVRPQATGLLFQYVCGLMLIAGLLVGPCFSVAYGQSKTAKKPKAITKKAKGAEQEESPESPLEEVDFGAPIKLRDGDTPDELDATPEGRKRLEELESRAKEIFKDRDRVERELRPLIIPRDRLVGEVTVLNQQILNAQQAVNQWQNQRGKLLQQLNNGGNNTDGIRNQINELELQIGMANQAIMVNRDEIAERTPEIAALNQQIQPLHARLLKLWLELNDFRKQWVEIRQPQSKYAHGNFEALKQVIDDWLLIDGLWPDAFCWAALTNYELGNYEAAWDYVEKAGELRTTLHFPKAWAQGEALRGMIAAQIPDRRSKAAGHLQSAQVYVNKDKNTNWQTYFLVGRAVVENDKQAAKARTNFDKALKINPDAACIKFWYAHLQNTTTTPTVRDVAAGTKTLEALWEKSTKQSWRLAQELVLAYDAGFRKADADRVWEVVLELAPQERHNELKAAREAAAEKLKSGNAGTAPAKSKTAKTVDKNAE